MAGRSLRSVLAILIPAAVAASIVGVVLNGYSRELDGILSEGPVEAAGSGLPPILHRVADSLSTRDLARLLAGQFISPDRTDPSSGFKRTCYAFLIARNYERERLQAFFFERTPFAFPQSSPVPGFEGAARAYFGVPPGRLTAGEAVLLFHLARFPDAPAPVTDPEHAIELRNRLLLDLMNDGVITSPQYRSESVRPLILSGSHPSVW